MYPYRAHYFMDRKRELDEQLAALSKREAGIRAKMAAIRLRQIPATRQEWIEQQAHGRILKMPALNEDLDQAEEKTVSETNLGDAERAANQCVEKLEREPKDIAAREKLARILAERLGQAELGIEQLELDKFKLRKIFVGD